MLHSRANLLAAKGPGMVQQISQCPMGSPLPDGQLSDLVTEKVVSERAFGGFRNIRPLGIL